MKTNDYFVEIINAYAQNKQLQCKHKNVLADTWTNWKDWSGQPYFLFDNNYKYRIKPEPKYRSYENANEFLKAEKEHGPYFTMIDDGEYEFYSVIDINWDDIYYFDRGELKCITISDFTSKFKWQDGTPCGVLVDDIDLNKIEV